MCAMTRLEIVDSIYSLSKSQGYYTRMYKSLKDLEKQNPEKYEEVMEELENQNFKDAVDMIMYFET